MLLADRTASPYSLMWTKKKGGPNRPSLRTNRWLIVELASAPHPAAEKVGSAGPIAAGRPFVELGPWFPFHWGGPEPLRWAYPAPALRAHPNCRTAGPDRLPAVRLPCPRR